MRCACPSRIAGWAGAFFVGKRGSGADRRYIRRPQCEIWAKYTELLAQKAYFLRHYVQAEKNFKTHLFFYRKRTIECLKAARNC